MDLETLQELANHAVDETRISQFPPEIKGRILHADADIFSYKACDLEYSYGQNVTDLLDIIHVWRKLASAEKIVLHLTMGTKGGREQIARVSKYQGKRDKSDQDKIDRVTDLREWMATCHNSPNIIPHANYLQEADDSLCQHMWMAKQDSTLDYVLFSPDKDLWMVGGKHIDKDTCEIQEFPWGYGRTEFITDIADRKKLKGKGTSWFWHQMLMGDTADNIPGLPYLSKELIATYVPNAAMAEAQRKISSGRLPSGTVMTHKQKAQALAKYNTLYKKQDAKKIGPVLAARYLQNCLTDRMAYQYVLEAYQGWYQNKAVFFTWNDTRMECTPYEMMLEQARLLWMRREVNEDVADWFKEILNG